MKSISLILCLLVVKTKSSYFDDFKGALMSVESSCENLLNDVVADVKSTVHCTILAMEQVLAMNGVGPEPEANNECYRERDKINFDIDVSKDDRNTHDSQPENVVQEIHSSISKINTTLSHILDNTGHERIENLKRELTHEHNRLAEVGLLLRIELEKVSQRMKREFPDIDLGSDKSSLDSVWNNMKILYEVEKNDKNSSKEIGEVLNEALDVLHINTTSGIKSDEEKINVIMKELEQESNINKDSSTIVHHELPLLKDEQSALQNNLELVKPIPANTLTKVQQEALNNVSAVATDAFTHVQDVATNVLNKVHDVAESALSNVESVAKQFSHSDKALKGVAEYIMDKSSDFENSKPSSETSQSTNNLSNTIFQPEQTVSKDEQSVLQNNLGAAKLIPVNTPMEVQQAAASALSEVQDVATNALNDVQNVAKTALSNVEDVAKKVLGNSDTALADVAHYITDKSSSFVNSKSPGETSQTTSKVTNSNKNLDPLSQFNFGASDGMGFFKDALKSQDLLDNFFTQHAKDGSSAFGDPKLFNSKF